MQSVEYNHAPPLGGTDLKTHPVQSAEVAQARVFEEMLQAEFAQLTRAYSSAGMRNQRNETEGRHGRPSEELVQIHARIDEVHRLLQRLKGRFQLRSDEWSADSA